MQEFSHELFPPSRPNGATRTSKNGHYGGFAAVVGYLNGRDTWISIYDAVETKVTK